MGEFGIEELSDLNVLAAEHGLELTPDGCHLRWARTNPKHPRNWHPVRKSYDIVMISLLEFFT